MNEATEARSLQELFGSFRAEWLRESLFSLFNEPTYFPSLRDRRPCVLVGGRGTGKTTVLRCMSYEGQKALSEVAAREPEQADYIGLYHRVNTNRVSAFVGPEKTDQEWQRLFGHYINILVVEMILEFLDWREPSEGERLPGPACQKIAQSLGLDDVCTEQELAISVAGARQKLELYVNNFDGPPPTLSMLQSPIDVAISEARKLPPLRKKTFYILLDEYENFLDYQQAIVNTLIKHSGEGYLFKIGVRELGWRVRYTINGKEHLISPADFELIHIEKSLERDFGSFARKVCETRIAQWAANTGSAHLPLDSLLPELSYESEAELLGVEAKVFDLKARLRHSKPVLDFNDITDFDLYVLWMLNQADDRKTTKDLQAYNVGSSTIRNRLHNYRYAMLFTIAGNGAEIGKYYCGNRVFSLLARNNLRFYLQLISHSLELHIRAGNSIATPVSVKDQTHAARDVGLRYLTELEGVTVQGAQLVKLVLGFGRLFQLFSRNPAGSRPECVEFHIKKTSNPSQETLQAAAALLKEAVMNLALVRSPGTKLATESDVREWDYAIHPIFAPYFNFSHRKKRKIEVSEMDLLNMISSPQDAIKTLLKDRASLIDQDPPVQLKLFDEYFSAQNDHVISG